MDRVVKAMTITKTFKPSSTYSGIFFSIPVFLNSILTKDNFTLLPPDPDDHNGQTKMKLRRICLTLATTIFICTSPARLTEIAGGNFELWPGSWIIFFFIPRLLIYGQTIIFSIVCAFSFPSFYQEAKIATKRICSCRIHRLIQHKTLTEQWNDNSFPFRLLFCFF